MLNSVCELESLGKRAVSIQIWLCWRKSQAFIESEGKDGKVVAVDARINDIARKCQGDLIHQHNPKLLPLLVARSRHITATSKNVEPDKPLSRFLLHCDNDIFRHIAPYCFILSPDKLQEEVERDITFQKEAEYCCDCEGWFLPLTCYCLAYNGYSS